MEWAKKTVNGMLVATCTVTGVASGTAYTPEIDFISYGSNNNRYIGITCVASAVSGTNLDVSLLGSSAQGTADASMEYTHVSDALVADITNAAKTKSAIVDFNLYPTPYYKIGFLVDSSEVANTIDVTIVVPQ